MPVVDDARDPSLENLLQLHREVMLSGLHVMIPGKIVSYDADKQMAVVQPLVKNRYLAEDGETVVVEDYPATHNCPVVFIGPARGRMTWPVAAGDVCELRIASSSLARWVATAAGSTVDPGDDRRHDLSDAVCQVGLHSPASPLTDAPTDAVVIHVDGTTTTLKLGSSAAADAAVKGTTYRTAEDTYFLALQTFLTAILGFPALATYFASGAPATALTTWGTAITNFNLAASTYLSQKVTLE